MAVPTGIGIYIGEDQIRGVKLRRTARGISLQRLGAVPTPAGAISGGVPLDVRLLAEGIRRLLKSYDITGGSAVVGLPGRAATSRVLELPKMSREEQKTVVAGEMEHYRMIPPGQGTFDFIELDEPEEGRSRVRLLLMAADRRIVDSYREALRLAGLQMTALEPFSLGAARAVYSSLGEGSVALITVGARSTELAIFEKGYMRYSRQIDIGSLNMKEELAEAVSSGESVQEQPVQRPEVRAPEDHVPRLDAATGNLPLLLYEIRRSLDFYHREAIGRTQVERVMLCADADQLAGLSSYLESNLGLRVKVCDPFRGLHYSDAQFNPEFLARAGVGFAPAVGMALRAIDEVPEAPRMDLSVTGPESVLARSAPRRLTWALVVSVLLLIGAVIAALQLWGVRAQRERELAAAREELARVAEVAEEMTAAAQRVKEAQAIVQMRGLPWSQILQQVAEFMPQGSWLTDLTTDPGSTNMLSLKGGALSADSVATLMDSLTRSALFEMPNMKSIQKDTTKSIPVVKFEIKVMVRQPAPAPPSQQSAPAGEAQ
jgi:type IV pilus assembly protein PilM